MRPNKVQADPKMQLNNTQVANQAFQTNLTSLNLLQLKYLTGNLEFKVT